MTAVFQDVREYSIGILQSLNWDRRLAVLEVIKLARHDPMIPAEYIRDVIGIVLTNNDQPNPHPFIDPMEKLVDTRRQTS